MHGAPGVARDGKVSRALTILSRSRTDKLHPGREATRHPSYEGSGPIRWEHQALFDLSTQSVSLEPGRSVRAA